MKTRILFKTRLTRYLELHQTSKFRRRAKSVQKRCFELITQREQSLKIALNRRNKKKQ